MPPGAQLQHARTHTHTTDGTHYVELHWTARAPTPQHQQRASLLFSRYTLASSRPTTSAAKFTSQGLAHGESPPRPPSLSKEAGRPASRSALVATLRRRCAVLHHCLCWKRRRLARNREYCETQRASKAGQESTTDGRTNSTWPLLWLDSLHTTR